MANEFLASPVVPNGEPITKHEHKKLYILLSVLVAIAIIFLITLEVVPNQLELSGTLSPVSRQDSFPSLVRLQGVPQPTPEQIEDSSKLLQNARIMTPKETTVALDQFHAQLQNSTSSINK